MNQTEFFNWFHHSFLPVLQEPCKGDLTLYHHRIDEVFMFMRRPGNRYSYLTYAFLLTAWLNESMFDSVMTAPVKLGLIGFVARLEESEENYWDHAKDKTGILPRRGVDYER